MNICIPIHPRPEGGGNFFLLNFLRYLDAHGVPRTDRLDGQYDVLFTSHWQVDAPDVWRGLRANPRARVVHRIDGAAQDYGRADGPRADAVQHEVNRLADLTVFQSRYCRHATREKFPVIVHDGPVIYNPVDVDQFTPVGERLPRFAARGPQVIAVTWSTNPKKGAAGVYAAARANPDVQFVLAGRFLDATALPNVRALGVLGRAGLARALRSCDALLTFSENEACPNVVLEGLASGLPILFKDSGAAQECVGECGAAVEVDTFRAALDRLMADRASLSAKARERALAHFHPEVIFVRYLAEIEGALARPTAIPEAERAARARLYRPPLRWRLRRWRARLREII